MNPPVGLKSTVIPSDRWVQLETEAQVRKMLDGVTINGNSPDSVDDLEEEEEAVEIESLGSELVEIFENERVREREVLEQEAAAKEAERVAIEQEKARLEREEARLRVVEEEARTNKIRKVRETRQKAHNLQEKNAVETVTNAQKLQKKANVNDNCILFVSELDRGVADAPNILCRIIDTRDNVNFKLACAAGVIDTWIARNGFQLEESALVFPFRTDKVVSIRSAVKELSDGNGQGVIKCLCTGTCNTSRCTCRKNGLLCKSRCHGTNTRSFCKNLGPSSAETEAARPSKASNST